MSLSYAQKVAGTSPRVERLKGFKARSWCGLRCQSARSRTFHLEFSRRSDFDLDFNFH